MDFYYTTSNGTEHGPFSEVQVLSWYRHSFLPSHLTIRAHKDGDVMYAETLADLVARNGPANPLIHSPDVHTDCVSKSVLEEHVKKWENAQKKLEKEQARLKKEQEQFKKEQEQWRKEQEQKPTKSEKKEIKKEQEEQKKEKEQLENQVQRLKKEQEQWKKEQDKLKKEVEKVKKDIKERTTLSDIAEANHKDRLNQLDDDYFTLADRLEELENAAPEWRDEVKKAMITCGRGIHEERHRREHEIEQIKETIELHLRTAEKMALEKNKMRLERDIQDANEELMEQLHEELKKRQPSQPAIGDRCVMFNHFSREYDLHGTVRFVSEENGNLLLGYELDAPQPYDNNDGVYKGVRHFQTRPGYAHFERVERGKMHNMTGDC